jgi:FtsH-binding integral membrane protein
MAFTPDFRTTSGRPAAGVATVDAGLRTYMLRVFNWMASGLLLTGIVAYVVANTSLRDVFYQMVSVQNALGDSVSVLRPTGLGWLSMIAPLAFVMVLSFGVNRLSRTTAQALFWVFCAAMGASLTNIFFVYEQTSIVRVFFITSATFAGMSLWGYTTKADLSRFGSFLMMGLIGIIIAFVVNIFLHSAMLQFVASIIGVLVFTGLTAFDVQRIKATYTQYLYAAGPDETAKRSVYDALSLYLNFINLFTLLLQLTGTRSSNN